ncbi:MAG: YigZ family protein [Bacteroidota bacterium]|nr:YigZ family protein [Bacteroidota bacterium]
MPEITSYKTINRKSEGYFKDRGSKFYSFAFPVETEEETEKHREKLRKEYHDARHHVYAFRLGIDGKTFRASDDGEPSNSSGPPVLGQIKSDELTNILIVVVRYFGGTKLGIPGLINAYKTAAKEAIKNTKIVTKAIKAKFKFSYDYAFTNSMMSFVHAEDIQILDQNFEASCEMFVAVPLNQAKKITAKLDNTKGIAYESLGEVIL